MYNRKKSNLFSLHTLTNKVVFLPIVHFFFSTCLVYLSEKEIVMNCKSYTVW